MSKPTLDYQRAAAPLEQAYTLPTQAYLDPSLYEQEIDAFMGDVWHPVARVEQVARPGDYLCVDLFGQPLMVVRDREDQIRVMSRVCLHRAAPVASGCGNSTHFTCPYHAWSYDLTGQLVRAPLMDGAQDFDDRTQALSQARVELWQGFVMANFSDQPRPFIDQISTFETYFQPFDLGEMEIATTLEYSSNWNWKVLVENFMEAYHHIAIHSKTFEPDFHARDSKIPDNDGPWSILHMPAATPGEPSTNPKLEDWQKDDLFANVIFPMFLIGIKDTSMVWYQVLPEGVDTMRLKIHICLPRSWRAMDDFADIVEQVSAGIAAIHEEDIHANDLVWQGLNSRFYKPGRLSPLERSIWQFNQWWLERLKLT